MPVYVALRTNRPQSQRPKAINRSAINSEYYFTINVNKDGVYCACTSWRYY